MSIITRKRKSILLKKFAVLFYYLWHFCIVIVMFASLPMFPISVMFIILLHDYISAFNLKVLMLLGYKIDETKISYIISKKLFGNLGKKLKIKIQEIELKIQEELK